MNKKKNHVVIAMRVMQYIYIYFFFSLYDGEKKNNKYQNRYRYLAEVRRPGTRALVGTVEFPKETREIKITENIDRVVYSET